MRKKIEDLWNFYLLGFQENERSACEKVSLVLNL